MDDWKVIGTEPYTRRDGSLTDLWVWQRPCRHCGKPVTVKTPAMALQSGSFATKHCDECKDPKAVDQGRARAAVWRARNARILANTQKGAENEHAKK